jgi:3-oxoacyl-[acyl-carrier protein] reductase
VRLKDKIALVTGSANGIGRAIAVKLAQEGADVVVNDIPLQQERARLVSEEIAGIGRNSMVVLADVSKTDEVNGMADAVLKKFGRLDILAFLKTMMARRSGKVLNLASNSVWSVWKGFGQYAAAKAGIVAFTKVLALEMTEYGINVNAIAPGFTGTEGALARSGAAHIERMEREIPLGRIGKT